MISRSGAKREGEAAGGGEKIFAIVFLFCR